MNWSLAQYSRQRRTFIAERELHHPMVAASTLIFVVTWAVGWLWSAVLLQQGLRSVPLR